MNYIVIVFNTCMHILNVYFEDGPYNEPQQIVTVCNCIPSTSSVCIPIHTICSRSTRSASQLNRLQTIHSVCVQRTY